MRYITTALAFIGAFVASTATSACWTLFFDEPEMPESLREKC